MRYKYLYHIEYRILGAVRIYVLKIAQTNLNSVLVLTIRWKANLSVWVTMKVIRRVSKICKKRLLALSCLFVRLCVRMEQLGCHWTDFHEIW
jgi:hypothetical protein